MGCGAEFLELHPYIEEDEEHQGAIALPPVCSLPPMTGSQREGPSRVAWGRVISASTAFYP